jgi:8-oxo-dGTP pyrophosphatase MutT (NUDIX family)
MDKWKRIESQYIYKTPFGNLRKDKCLVPNGNTIDGYYVHEYSDWVNAIVLTKEGDIVLVKQFRYPADQFTLEIPAGKKEDNETFEEAIMREIKEETGYISKENPILLGEFLVNPATQTNKVISFLITDAYKESTQNLDENEEIDVQLIPIKELESRIKHREINQLFTVSAFYIAKDYLTNKILK